VPSISNGRRVVGWLLGGAAALLLSVGCMDDPGERDLSVEMLAEDAEVSLGDSAVIHVEAEGPRLVGILVDFGDQSVQREDLPLPVHVLRRFAHLYEEVGVYQVEALVADARGDTLTAHATVEVVPAPEE